MSTIESSKTTIRVAVDAMGGDNAPHEIIKGAMDALSENERIHLLLLGQMTVIEDALKGYTYDTNRVEIVSCEEIIEMAETPTIAIRRKKNSSIVVGMNMIKEGTADAFVSAGNTGAILASGQFIAKPLPGIKRTALGVLMPTKNGVTLLIDAGANMDARSEHLIQFAKMGSIYMEHVIGRKDPKVAIVNVGAEEEKGNALVKETFPLLKEQKNIHFVGSIEARDIPAGNVDVIVCDAFTGNVILKLYEGLSKTLFGIIKEALTSSVTSKIGALLALPAIKKKISIFMTEEHGGAPLLGLNGLVVKTHGSAKAIEVKNSILECEAFTLANIPQKILDGMKEDKDGT